MPSKLYWSLWREGAVRETCVTTRRFMKDLLSSQKVIEALPKNLHSKGILERLTFLYGNCPDLVSLAGWEVRVERIPRGRSGKKTQLMRYLFDRGIVMRRTRPRTPSRQRPPQRVAPGLIYYNAPPNLTSTGILSSTQRNSIRDFYSAGSTTWTALDNSTDSNDQR